MRGRGLVKIMVILIMILIGYSVVQTADFFEDSLNSSVNISELDDGGDDAGSVFV